MESANLTPYCICPVLVSIVCRVVGDLISIRNTVFRVLASKLVEKKKHIQG